MSSENIDNAEPVMLKGKLLYTIELDLAVPLVVPNGPKGTRAIISLTGKVHGPQLNGTIVGPSSDWLSISPEGQMVGIDVHLVIKTDDDQLIYQHVLGRSQREPDNPANSVIRVAGQFEAPPGKYQYLNSKFVFGHGKKTGNKIVIDYYDTF